MTKWSDIPFDESFVDSTTEIVTLRDLDFNDRVKFSTPTLGKQVIPVHKISDIPLLNGFRQLEQDKVYRFVEEISSSESLLIPAGWNGYLVGMHNAITKFDYTGTGTSLKTLDIFGIISSIANAGGGAITVTTSAAHGLLDGQFVNITGTTSYNQQKLLVSNASGSVFDVQIPFVANESGDFDTGYDAVNIVNIGFTTVASNVAWVDIEAATQSSVFRYNNIKVNGFIALGFIDGGTIIGCDGNLDTTSDGLSIGSIVKANISKTTISNIGTVANRALLAVTGPTTGDIVFKEMKFNVTLASQSPIFIDDNIPSTAQVSITDSPDNNVADNYFDILAIDGIDQVDSRVYAFNNGQRADSLNNLTSPINNFHVTSQADLEVLFGTDIEIPIDIGTTITLDESFTMTKPFKLGGGSTLEVRPNTTRTILTHTGPGALFQQTTATPIRSIVLKDFTILGDASGVPGAGTNSIFNLKGTNFVIFEDVQLTDLDNIGIVEDFVALRFGGISPTNVNNGVIIVNPLIVNSFGNILLQFADTRFTFFSFILGLPAEIRLDAITTLNMFPNSAMAYIPPTVPTGSLVTANRIAVGNGKLFQQGLDIAVNSVADNGSGKARFTTAVAHELVVNKVITLSGFAGEPSYNGTFRVTAVDTPETGVTFDVEAITFTATDTGTMNAASVTGNTTPVLTTDNPSEQDSMFIGDSGLEIFGSEVTSSSLAQNAFEVITSGSWAYSTELERFSQGVTTQGQLTCTAPASKKYNVTFSATLEKSGGGSLNVGIVILKNGVNVSFNPPHTVNTGKIQISGSDIVELVDGDDLDIAVINYDASAAAIIISQASLIPTSA